MSRMLSPSCLLTRARCYPRPVPSPRSAQTYEELARRLQARDPDLIAAVDEVDWTLLRWSLGLSPLERLRACSQATRTLGRLRDAAAAQR